MNDTPDVKTKPPSKCRASVGPHYLHFLETGREPKFRSEKSQADDPVLPAIQAPLSLPEKDRMGKKWFTVSDRPQVPWRGPARADQVAKEVQVEHEQT